MLYAPTYGVIDSGNIGIYVAACAAHHDLDVHFFGGDETPSTLNVLSPLGDFSENKLAVCSKITDLPCCDVLFLNVNSLFERNYSAKVIEPLIQKNGILVLFQKGASQYLEFNLHSGLTVLGGLVWLKPSKISSNTVKHDFGSLIELGPYYSLEDVLSGKKQKKLEDYLLNPFLNSRINFSYVDNFSDKSWTRLAFNLPYFVFSVLENKFSQKVFLDKRSAKKARKLRQEVSLLAIQENVTLDENFIHEMDAKLLEAPDSYPGLKQDFDHGNELFLNDLFGMLLDVRDKYSLKVEGITSSYKKLIELEKHRKTI
jgi:ketopantoate reductase